MCYEERMNELMDQLNKAIASVNKLDYFKNELLKILDAKEKHEDALSKSIQEYFEDINKSLFGIGIEKGRVGTIGEIRTWKDGKRYKKMPNGKWVRVYQQHDRSAEISIARLKGKVKNAKSVDELMNIVMSNIHRFEDENGQVLPIVEELKKEVAAGKLRLNAGKPSTKEQIEKFKKEHQESESQKYDRIISSYKSEYEKNKELNNELLKNEDNQDKINKLNDLLNILKNNHVEMVKILDEDYEKNILNGDQHDELSDVNARNNGLINKINSDIEIIKQAINNKKIKEQLESINVDNLSDAEKKLINTISTSFENMLKKLTYSWEIRQAVEKFLQIDPENNELNILKQKWIKLNKFKGVEDVQQYATKVKNEQLETAKKEKEAKKKAAHEKKLAKVRSAAGEYKEPESTKEFEKIEIDNMPDHFIHRATLRENVQRVVDFMNENKAVNNDINYLMKNLYLMDAAAMKRWNLRSDNVELKLVNDNHCFYSPDERSVTTKITDTPDGIETFIHEITHYIDNCLAEENSKYTKQDPHITQNDELLKAVKSMLLKTWDDVPEKLRNFIAEKENESGYYQWQKDVREQYKKMPGNSVDEMQQKKEFAKQVNQEGNEKWKNHCEKMRQYGELEDMIAALSGGNMDKLTFGHNYFNSVAHRTSELLANYVSLSFTQKEQLQLFKESFPSVAMQLDNTIAKMVNIFDKRLNIVDGEIRIKKSYTEKMNILLEGLKRW